MILMMLVVKMMTRMMMVMTMVISSMVDAAVVQTMKTAVVTLVDDSCDDGDDQNHAPVVAMMNIMVMTMSLEMMASSIDDGDHRFLLRCYAENERSDEDCVENLESC